jgi:hypothetical protein
MALETRAVAATTRMTRSPAPGTPVAKVQNRRLKGPLSSVGIFETALKPPTGERISLVRVNDRTLEFNDAAFETNHSGVGSIVSTELREDVLDATLHGLFGD